MNPDKNNQHQLLNGYWILAGIIVAGLLTLSTLADTWPHINPQVQQQISLFPYAFSIAIGYLSWIGIVLGINFVRSYVPMFSRSHSYWWLLHGSLSIIIGLLHLLLDTFTLWLVFSAKFSYLVAVAEKTLRWLPYEILAYWACLGLLTVVAKRHSAEDKNQAAYLCRIAIKTDDETIMLDVANVDWIEACDNYVIIWKAGERFMLKDSMAHLESALDPTCFQRVHRSAIVNLRKVQKLNRDNRGNLFVKLHCGKNLAISRRRRAQVSKVITKGL